MPIITFQPGRPCPRISEPSASSWKVVFHFASRLTKTVEADGSDAGTLKRLGAKDFGSVIVGIGDDIEATKISDYGYPEPDEPHPIPDEPQARKIRQAVAATRGNALVTPIVHGYGPLDDFSRRLRIVADSPADGVWINRYGYLSEEKLDAIGEIWK
mgnify:CR=1 FL=1